MQPASPLTQWGGSEWIIDLTARPEDPVNGVEITGSLYSRARAPQSAFAPMAVQDLVVTNLSGSLPRTFPIGGRP